MPKFSHFQSYHTTRACMPPTSSIINSNSIRPQSSEQKTRKKTSELTPCAIGINFFKLCNDILIYYIYGRSTKWSRKIREARRPGRIQLFLCTIGQVFTVMHKSWYRSVYYSRNKHISPIRRMFTKTEYFFYYFLGSKIDVFIGSDIGADRRGAKEVAGT